MEDSGVDTSSDADTRDRVVDGVCREEEKKAGSVLNGGQYDDGVGRAEGQGAWAVVPAKFLYRTSAPAYWKVQERPPSSDAIFKQPVHRWIIHHAYFPCLCNGSSKICITIPCHIFKFWAFTGMMFPVGSMTFWFFVSILGQPMCVLLYYHDVMNRKVRNEWTKGSSPQ